MKWKFNQEQPIYLQIMDHIKTQIATGRLKPGDKLASVRDMAVEAGVNPNTMQKALSELERVGILYSQRTAGRFVAEGEQKTRSLQEELVKEQIEKFIDSMTTLGFEPEEIIKEVRAYLD